MPRLAVLASGNGGNFEALVMALRSAPSPHECVLLVSDRSEALALSRARGLGVPALHIPWSGQTRTEAEAELEKALSSVGAQLIALAGFMRLLGPDFVRAHRNCLVNIHPSLLPKWPGKNSIRCAFEAGETEYGASVHYVDEGMDTGPVIAQSSFIPEPGSSLETIEERMHEIEHSLFPLTVIELLDRIKARGED